MADSMEALYMVLERVAIQVILMIEFAALKNVYHPFQFLEKSLQLWTSFSYLIGRPCC